MNMKQHISLKSESPSPRTFFPIPFRILAVQLYCTDTYLTTYLHCQNFTNSSSPTQFINLNKNVSKFWFILFVEENSILNRDYLIGTRWRKLLSFAPFSTRVVSVLVSVMTSCMIKFLECKFDFTVVKLVSNASRMTVITSVFPGKNRFFL